MAVVCPIFMLGRPYALWGEVVPGDRRGTEIGYATANIEPLDECQLLPERGVYAVRVPVPGDVVTANDSGALPRIEAHIFGFGGQLRGRNVKVEWIRRLRRERKFARDG